MDNGIPVDGGFLIPNGEKFPPGSPVDLQRRIGTLLIESGLTVHQAEGLIVNLALGLLSANSASPQEARERVLHMSRELARLAPSAAQAQFELKQRRDLSIRRGGARG